MSDEGRRLEFLTTAQVKERHGFDPTPCGERHEAAGRFIFNKLVPVGDGFVRVWLKDAVEQRAAELKGGAK